MTYSNDALILWASHFLTPGNTLTFGGDGASMAITERGEAALNDLAKGGAIEACQPEDSIPNRRAYKATKADLRPQLKARCDGSDPFAWIKHNEFVVFARKEDAHCL
jgi:hypothetical protein